MLVVDAKVYFKKTSEGGLCKDGVSGMQPSFSVTGDLIACKVNGKNEITSFVLGKEYNVSIELFYGEIFAEEIKQGYHFSLNIGGKKFAEGVVLNAR